MAAISEGDIPLSQRAKLTLQGTLGAPAEIMFRALSFGDTPFRRFNYDNEQQNKSPVGIMENMDRAEANDNLKALMSGYDNNPYSRPDSATQTAGLNLDDVQKFVTSPGVVGKALDYAQPFIQNVLPDNVKVDTGLIYNQEKPEDSYTGIKFTIPFN